LSAEAPTTNGLEASAVAPSRYNFSLEEQVLRYKGELIKRALETSDGSVTRAARLLGVTHQDSPSFSMDGKRTCCLRGNLAKPRRRSIIRFH